MNNNTAIDLSDIPEITDFSNARKNPYFERIKKYGFSITEYYTADDVAEIIKDTCSRRIDVLNLDSEEQKAFERYKKAHGYTGD
jgi:hypothetical protein